MALKKVLFHPTGFPVEYHRIRSVTLVANVQLPGSTEPESRISIDVESFKDEASAKSGKAPVDSMRISHSVAKNAAISLAEAYSLIKQNAALAGSEDV